MQAIQIHKMFIVDNTADISPGESLGGIQLGTSIKDINLLDFIVKADLANEIIFSYKEYFDIHVGKSDNKVSKICARKDYKGKFRTLEIGSSISHLLSNEIQLKLDFLDNEFELTQVDGLRFGTLNSNFTFDQIPTLTIDYITVFSKNIDGYSEDGYRKFSKNDFT